MIRLHTRTTAAAVCQTRGQKVPAGERGERGSAAKAARILSRRSGDGSGQARLASSSARSRGPGRGGSERMIFLVEKTPQFFHGVAITAGGRVGRDTEDGGGFLEG